MPLVSICIPTFNGAEYLQETLNSVKAQTYLNIEIIISDDNSRDDTLYIIDKFRKEANFPVYIYNHKPSGIGANWNNCIKKSNGDYIKFLFQDDLLFPSCIEEMIKVFKSNKSTGLVTCKREILEPEFPDEFQINWIKAYNDLQQGWDFGNDGIIFLNKEFLKKSDILKSRRNRIGEPTAVLFKTYIIKKVGFFREDLVQDLDYEFYNRVLKNYRIALIKNKLVGFRLHSGQTTYLNKHVSINDSKGIDHIFIRDFFWYLDRAEKRRLLLKYFPRLKRLIKMVW